MEYEDILRTTAVYKTVEQIESQINKEREKIITEAFEKIGVNPNVVIEQQKEINQLRAYIEEHIKWHIVEEGDFPERPSGRTDELGIKWFVVNESYIVTDKTGRVYIAEYDFCNRYFWYGSSSRKIDVIAWMPLPASFKKAER